MLVSGRIRGIFALTAAVYAAAPSADSPDFFETRVRPVLATNCYACHTNSALGGVRLDSRENVLKVIVPGDPEKSAIIAALRQTGKIKMPPGGKLKDAEVEDIAAWIKAGAVWPESSKAAANPKGEYVITPEQRAFWSFQPLKKPAIPQASDWAKTDIDKFVLAKLDQQGLKPVKAADKRTLIRRAALDLTGLPPTFDEIDAFEKDASPDAFAKVVDRLLASPAYGERWGRIWLDVARYGEDDYRSLDPMGRGLNPYPFAYLYRDWVIKAMNDDMPYDAFVKAQLAADLNGANARDLPALGFLGLGPWYYDNGAVEITRADERHDRVDVVSRGFLGLTVGCARCHDHKYDPIPTKDYYSLAGVFLNTIYHEYPQVPQAAVDEYKKREKDIEAREKLLREFSETETEQLAQALAFQASKYMMAAWKITGDNKADLAQVANEDKLDYELLDRWAKFLAKPPVKYPYLTKWQEMIKAKGKKADAQKLADEFQKTLIEVMFERREMKEENEIIEAKALPGTKKKKKGNLPNEFVTNDDFCPGCGLELKTLPPEKMNLYIDVFQRDLSDDVNPDVPGSKVKPGLLVFRGWSLERQLSAERKSYIDALRADIEKLHKEQPPHFPYVHGVIDAEKPVDLKLSLRGSPYNLGDEVPRHFLSILDPAPLDHGSGRLDLAEQIVKQPIAMRVIVNRVWRAHFGTGLVDTPSNFGITGERPTNPELLEYLAQWFVENGMSMKKLHREIMLSAVYQLGNDDVKENLDKDPANRLYWRANRHRMDAEQIRDSILAVTGSLDRKMSGPSEPLAPEFKRRTVYGKVSRYRLDEYLQLFDFPSPNISAEKRFTTTVPLQRLFFMNSDFVQQHAETIAQKIADAPDSAARIQKAYKMIFAREATPQEIQLGLEYVRAEPMKEYEERKAKPPKKDEDESEEKKPAPPPATAWGRYIKVLLSSNEFLFVN